MAMVLMLMLPAWLIAEVVAKLVNINASLVGCLHYLRGLSFAWCNIRVASV